MTVTPSVSLNLRITRIKSNDVFESNPLVGSSRNNTLGRVTRLMPMLTRFACPPEMPRDNAFPTTTSAHFCKRRSSIKRSTIKSRSAALRGSSRFRFKSA